MIPSRANPTGPLSSREVTGGPTSTKAGFPPVGRAAFFSRMSLLWTRFSRRFIPHLVWYGDQIDVRVTWGLQKLDASTLDDALDQFHSGDLFEIERLIKLNGVDFDTGLGPSGRDWELDFSLRGPISVEFKRRAKYPERRLP